jgi:DNA polymerase-3 subunit beta
MKLKVNKDVMLEGCQKVQSIVGTRTTLPILSNVLLTAEDDTLFLSTTDLEVSVRTSVDAKVTRAGATTLPARRLFSIFRELSSSDIEIDVNDKNVATIKSGASIFKVIGISEEDFPPLPTFQGGRAYTLDQGVFREMLRSTGYAASTDETRYVLNGVLLSFKDDKLKAVATDGRRLALIEQEVEFPKESEAELVIPSKTVDELCKTLGDEGPLKIQATENQIAFEFSAQAGESGETGDMLVVSKLIEGAYPNFQQVIPSSCEERVAIDRESLLTAVRRVALMTSDKGNSVKLSLTKNSIQVSAVTPEVGEASESIPVKYSGKDIAVAFNPEFITAPLKTIRSDEVYFELTDELSPGVLKCDTLFLYVLMPMRMS